MTLWAALRRGLDRLVLYLPLMVMASLAMGSWWLVRTLPRTSALADVRPVRKDPDYRLEAFSTQVFDARGRMIRQISGEQARHYPDGDELQMESVRFEAVNEQGGRLTATASRALTSGDGDRVTLLGQVHVVRTATGTTPRIEMNGQRLVALQKQQRLLSDDPVEILRGQDQFLARTLDFDMKTGQYELAGRVRATLLPASP